MLDLVELDLGYTTITDNFYRDVSPQRLLDGARIGLVAELRARGIADPPIGLLRARADGRGVVPAIEREIGKMLVRYGSRVEPRDLVYAAIRGELGALNDPYSVLFTKAELTGFTTALDGRSFGGIGVAVTIESDGVVRAADVFDGGPAALAGLRSGEQITAIDGLPALGLSTSALEAKLRGPVASVVRLTVRSAADTADRSLAIVRGTVTPPDVTARLLSRSVAYIQLRGFSLAAGDHVRAALVRLRAAGARATVLDLRGNGGGYESSAVRVASAFVAAGPVVALQTHHGSRRVTDADGSALPPLPLAVLVDGDSASGAELVTAAIADRGAGRVVGTQTFGKGVVQTVFPLPDGSALKVTTARYFTPAGRDIDRIGIRPDIVVAEPADAERGVPGRDPQLDAALAQLAR